HADRPALRRAKWAAAWRADSDRGRHWLLHGHRDRRLLVLPKRNPRLRDGCAALEGHVARSRWKDHRSAGPAIRERELPDLARWFAGRAEHHRASKRGQ